MPGIDVERGTAAAPQQGPNGSGRATILPDIESFVDAITFNGQLAAFLAVACEKILVYQPPSHADPGHAPHPGVQAAIRAYEAWKQAEGHGMATDVRHRSNPADFTQEPEILPLSLAGNWVAWSSDGVKIVASAETIEEAERLAAVAGETEPILERHPGRYRL